MASEASMNHAGRTYDHTFRDLRSDRRAKNRTRSHQKKYWNFRTISRADLPTSSSQQSHYVPTCELTSCSLPATRDTCPWKTFPADLSTAPVAKFTKREAFKTAQEDSHINQYRPKKPCFPKWELQGLKKAEAERVISERDWYDDIWGWYGQVFASEDICLWWDSDYGYGRDWYEWAGDKMYGCNWDDYEQEPEATKKQGWNSHVLKRWHRDPMGGWFRSDRKCEKIECACVREWDEPVLWHELDEWWYASFPPERSGVAEENALKAVEEVIEEAEVSVDDDWDVVSNASTEAWTELEHSDFDIPPHV